MVVDGCNSEREKITHYLRMICQLGFFTERKKSEMSPVKLFAVVITQLAGQKAVLLKRRLLCSRCGCLTM